MKILHLGDLHLGKRVNGYPMLEDQAHILGQIAAMAREHRPEAVVIAGDVYDKPVPPAEAVTLFDGFLTELTGAGARVIVIAGNHDSAERLAFGGELLKKSGVFMAGPGPAEAVRLTDEHGEVDFWPMSYVRPGAARALWPEADIPDTAAAVAQFIAHMDIYADRRNVLIAHQFVAGGERCDSEEMYAGGLDAVPHGLFAPFDYVALGHLHGPQRAGADHIRYSGSPLKYSFSERRHNKSVPLVTLGEKGRVTVELLPLTPLHDMAELRGDFASLLAGEGTEDYVRVTLTDEEEITEAVQRLRGRFPNIMRLDYDNTRTRALRSEAAEPMEASSPLELFSRLYELQNGREMSPEQRKYMEKLTSELWEASHETNLS